jgi:16S rRNA (guanine527-N7)-methyltransferase
MAVYSKEDVRRLIPVTDDVFARIATYHDLLLKWQKAINLVSPKTIPESWHRHFLDSMQIAQFLPQAGVLADIGSGAGFPGLVLAMMMPELNVHMIESDERKGQFMRTVSRETELKNVTIHTRRVEDMSEAIAPDIVTARALKSLPELLEFVSPWALKNPKLLCCFLKGRGADEEIVAAKNHFSFEVKSHKSLTEADAAVLVVTEIKRL